MRHWISSLSKIMPQAFVEYVRIADIDFSSSRPIKSSMLIALSGISLFRNLMGISYMVVSQY